MAKKTVIGLVQMSMTGDKNENLEKAVSLARKAASKGAQIICLPELFGTLYFPQKSKGKSAFLLAEPIPGKTTKNMGALAKELGIVIIVPLFEKAGKKFYNAIAVISEKGKLLGKYRKMHIPHDPLFWEANYFAEGNLGFKVFKTKFGKIAPLICFDQWFPEAARISALNGADIIFYPTAIATPVDGKEPDDWHSAWETIQRGHAIANGIHVAAVNRAGKEGKLKFWGGSFISDPFGKILKRASAKEEVVVASVDFSDNKRIRDGWGFFAKRRPKNYGAIKKRRFGSK